MTARLTHCPDGRPLHRSGQLPDGLATVSMLRRARRRLADGQKPVATLLYRSNEYAPLYEIAASVALAPLTPKQQARWDAARTCARCGRVESHPLDVWHEDRRLHHDCLLIERAVRAAASHIALRLQAVAWAQQVLADPDVVLLAVCRAPTSNSWSPVAVHAATVAGQVLVHELVWPARLDFMWPEVGGLDRPLCRPPGALDGELLVPRLAPLVGRRLVHTVAGRVDGYGWRSLTALGELGHITSPSDWSALYAGGAIRESRDDSWQRRLTAWFSEPRDRDRRWPGEDGLKPIQPIGWYAVDAVANMRGGLEAMAADEHDDPAACPALPPGPGVEPCGAPPTVSGYCPEHTDG